MLTIREYKRKILSLRSTRKITSSMKMISSVKLQRFMRVRHDAERYWKGLDGLPGAVAAAFGHRIHSPLITGYPEPVDALVLLVSGDRGMCGQYNNNAVREAVRLGEALGSKGMRSVFAFAGAKGQAVFRRRSLPVFRSYERLSSHPEYKAAAHAANELLGFFMSSEFHEIWIVYTVRISFLQEKPLSERLLPLPDLLTPAQKVREQGSMLLDESPSAALDAVVRLWVRARVHHAMVEAGISEHAARMSAMDSATANCDHMIHHYQQLSNRARQAAITTELNEIVTGKEALEN
jgi:F-type H+-transporting ATPase subunit gamma